MARLSEVIPRLGVQLDGEQIELIRSYLKELSEYNEHTNLVSQSDPLTVVSEHVLDSLAVIPVMEESLHRLGGAAVNLVDIGSGAGFPAVILCIARPSLQFCLVESIGKKARFLLHIAEKLGLQARLTVQCDRAEVLGRNGTYRGTFDFATARAVGKCDLVAELAVPLLKVGGKLLLQKSRNQLEEEKLRANSALPKLSASLEDIRMLDARALGKDRAIMIIAKTAHTPDLYPRSAARIKNAPLAG